MRTGKILLLLALILVVVTNTMVAQHGIRHQQPAFLELHETTVLEFEAPGLYDQQVSEAILFKRESGSNSFSRQEVAFESGKASFPVSFDDENITALEYYLELTTTSGETIAYPDIDSGNSPFQVDVVDSEEKELPVANFVDYTILSPRPDAPVLDDDLLIAVAVFFDDSDMEGGQFKLNLNGEDVSEDADISSSVIKYLPDHLNEGVHSVTVLLENENEVFEVVSWRFRVVSSEPEAFASNREVGELDVLSIEQRESPSGSVEISSSNQEIGGSNRDALGGRIQVSGQEGGWIYSMSGYFTSQESNRLQPQNRLTGDIRYKDRFHVKGGDVYPQLSSLSINGRRIRGVDSHLYLFNDFLEARFMMGRMNRSINNIYQNVRLEDRMMTGQSVGTLYFLDFAEGGRGSYQKNVIGGGLTFGSRDRFEFSIHGLKVEDDTTSLNVIDNYHDLLSLNPELGNQLTQADKNYLEQNPNNLRVSGANPTPMGNFVLGTGLKFTFDDQRIRFRSEGGASLLNYDISNGPLTRERAEDLGLDIDQDLENIFDQLSWLIIISDQMNNLPIRLQEIDGRTVADPFIPSSIFASDNRMDLNYLGNQLQIRYRWTGPDYHSLANSSIRRDISGFSLSDRIRFLDNQIYITLGFENLRDNLLGTREATLRTTTYRAGVSWFPVNQMLPRINISTRYRLRNNNTERNNPFVDSEFVNRSVRNYTLSDGDILSAPNPRYVETYSINSSITQKFKLLTLDHEMGVNIGLTRIEDELFEFGNSNNVNASLRLTSRVDRMARPLRTRVGFSVNKSELLSGLSNVNIQGVDFGVDTFLIDGSLNLNVNFAVTRNRFESRPLLVNENNNPGDSSDNYYEPGEDDDVTHRHTNAYSIRTGLQYKMNEQHAIHANAYLSNLSDVLGNMEMIPNDRILEARYIFSF